MRETVLTLAVVASIAISLLLPEAVNSQPTCGYPSCNAGKSGMLNVHVVCHTHDDVGWLFTVEQYYRGYVRDIIYSVIFHLNENPERRFVYVESAFFHRWWLDQSSEMKQRVKNLVQEGRLEFVGGGWVMNDEAVTHYEAIVDQMTLGLRWLNHTFGQCGQPSVVWQIDPFGHSREQASLFAQMNFHGLFLGRIDHQDIEHRGKTKQMEFIWNGSQSLNNASHIFTGVLPNVYWPPKGFCYDVNCWDEEITDLNSERKARELIGRVRDQSNRYRTNHTIITMGMDFHYRYAGKWFRNLEKLMKKINELQSNGTGVNIFYSTPACYLLALNQENLTWSSEANDFFPYSSEINSYWTGYYTSRPTLKEYSRKAQAFSQVCRQLVTFADLPDADIVTLQRAVAVMQHHDAITGTEKQHVANDYAKALAQGIYNCQIEVRLALGKLSSENGTEVILEDMVFCDKLNISQCHVTEIERVVRVVAYNPLARPRMWYLRVPVKANMYTITEDSTGKEVNFQVVPVSDGVQQLEERTSTAKFELVFQVVLPALGTSTFTLNRHQDNNPTQDRDSYLAQNEIGEELIIQNEYLTVRASGVTGLIESVTTKSGHVVPIRHTFQYYLSQPGFQTEKASGAYAFNPLFNRAYTVAPSARATVYKGELVEELHQNFTSWISQVVRLYKGRNYLELEWLVGPIPSRDYQGKEIISKFETGMYTNVTFYTDSNGRETIRRIRDFRPNWNLTVNEPVAGNYYPVSTWIYIKDEAADLQLTLLPDRAQGGASIEDGNIELMVHRRCFYDDGYGVEEPLNELGADGRGLVARGRHWLFLASINESAALVKEHAKSLFHQPQLVFIPLEASAYSPVLRTNATADLNFLSMNQELPPNVHLLNMELISHDQVMLRFEHFYAVDDPYPFSSPARVSLKNLFRHFRITSMRETTLSANKFVEEATSLNWNPGPNLQVPEESPVQALTEETSSPMELEPQEESATNSSVPAETSTDTSGQFPFADPLEFILSPMQIRTFLVRILRHIP